MYIMLISMINNNSHRTFFIISISEMMEERRKDVSKLDYEVLCSFIEEMLNEQVHTICLSLPDCDIDIKHRYKQRVFVKNDVYMGL